MVWSEDDLLIVDFLDVSFPAAASAAPDTRASASAVGVVGDSTDGTFCGCSWFTMHFHFILWLYPIILGKAWEKVFILWAPQCNKYKSPINQSFTKATAQGRDAKFSQPMRSGHQYLVKKKHSNGTSYLKSHPCSGGVCFWRASCISMALTVESNARLASIRRLQWSEIVTSRVVRTNISGWIDGTFAG